jgi:CarD family transcriptional regulator
VNISEQKYNIGDYVMHESAGVCKVGAIEELALQGKGSEKLYYQLLPVYHKDGQIITPVEDKNHRIRPVKSPEEMKAIMEHVGDLDVVQERNERQRQEKLKAKIAEFEPSSLAGVVKTVYLRKKSRLMAGKKSMSVDDRILQQAGERLFEEMAFSMKVEISAVEERFFRGLDSLC